MRITTTEVQTDFLLTGTKMMGRDYSFRLKKHVEVWSQEVNLPQKAVLLHSDSTKPYKPQHNRSASALLLILQDLVPYKISIVEILELTEVVNRVDQQHLE
jgi:hypothetical protein